MIKTAFEKNCRCGRSIRRIRTKNKPKRVAVPKETAADDNGFVYMYETVPAKDGLCERCFNEGKHHKVWKEEGINNSALLEWEESHYQRPW